MSLELRFLFSSVVMTGVSCWILSFPEDRPLTVAGTKSEFFSLSRPSTGGYAPLRSFSKYGPFTILFSSNDESLVVSLLWCSWRRVRALELLRRNLSVWVKIVLIIIYNWSCFFMNRSMSSSLNALSIPFLRSALSLREPRHPKRMVGILMLFLAAMLLRIDCSLSS